LALPSKKALSDSATAFEVALIDAAQTPIERPEKNNGDFTRQKEKIHVKKLCCCQ